MCPRLARVAGSEKKEKTIQESTGYRLGRLGLKREYLPLLRWGSGIRVGGMKTVLILSADWKAELAELFEGDETGIGASWAGFSPDESLLGAAGPGGQMVLYRGGSWGEIRRWRPAEASLRFDFWSDSRHLLTTGADRKLRIWDCAGGEERRSFDLPAPAAFLLSAPAEGLLAVGVSGTDAGTYYAERVLLYELKVEE